VGRIPDIDECDILHHTPTKSDIELIKEIGCASHSSQQEPIVSTEPLHRFTCKYQELVVYPTDEYVHCKFKEKCEFQTPSNVDATIYCDKPIISHDAAIRKDERERVLRWIINHCFCANKYDSDETLMVVDRTELEESLRAGDER
jgi:hypothetical protein